jgi:hypothetical protein
MGDPDSDSALKRTRLDELEDSMFPNADLEKMQRTALYSRLCSYKDLFYEISKEKEEMLQEFARGLPQGTTTQK